MEMKARTPPNDMQRVPALHVQVLEHCGRAQGTIARGRIREQETGPIVAVTGTTVDPSLPLQCTAALAVALNSTRSAIHILLHPHLFLLFSPKVFVSLSVGHRVCSSFLEKEN